jgi:hypothetical protein
MKKLLYLFSASLLVLTSCSKDDSPTIDPVTSTFVKKMVSTGIDGDVTTSITYNGNKVVSFVSNNIYKTNFTYTGDLITKVESLDEKNVIDSTIEYLYKDGKVISSTEKEVGAAYNYKIKYTYNSDGTVSFEEFKIDTTTGVEKEDGTIGKYTFKNGNLVKRESSYYGSENSVTYEYDAKYNPFKNVLGYNLLLDNEELGSANNSVKNTRVSGSTYVNTSTFVYDVNNFPTEEKSFDATGKLENTVQYFY